MSWLDSDDSDYDTSYLSQDLELAIYENKINWVKTLINQDGKDVNQRFNSNSTPLMLACFRSRHKIVKFLLERGADTSLTKDSGYQAIHYCCLTKPAECLRLLLKHPSMDVNARNNDGETALHMSASRGFETQVKLLLKHKDIKIDVEHEYMVSENEERINKLIRQAKNKDIQKYDKDKQKTTKNTKFESEV